MRLEIVDAKGAESRAFGVNRLAIVDNRALYLDLVAQKGAWRVFGRSSWWRQESGEAAPLLGGGLKRMATEYLGLGYERRIYVDGAVLRGEILVARDEAGMSGLFRHWLAKRCPFPFPLESEEAVASLMERLRREMPGCFLLEAKDRFGKGTAIAGIKILDPSGFERSISEGIANGAKSEIIRSAEEIFLGVIREFRLHEAARVVDWLLADAPDGAEVDMASGMKVLAVAEEGGMAYHIVARDGEEFLALVDDGESRWWDLLPVEKAESMAIRAVDNMHVHGDAIEKEAA